MPDTPHPSSILRGHKAQVHALCFIRRNERLVSGDADGFVVVWDLTTLRPTAVWRPHDNAILGLRAWGEDRIITHGRDHRLAVWQLAPADEASLDTRLPLDDTTTEPRPAPWLLHVIEVNTMNFCSFAALPEPAGDPIPGLLLAVPNTLESESIDLYHLPSQARRHTVAAAGKHGMVMALALARLHDTLVVAAGYEDGHAAVMQLQGSSWVTTYLTKVHSQPVLSLDARPGDGWFLTSSADAVVAKHPLELAIAAGAGAAPTVEVQPVKLVNTRHAGQQSLVVRDDGRIFATGGWDATVRVYSSRTLKEVATLKWHQTACYAVAIADVAARGSPGEGSQDAASQDVASQEVTFAAKELSVRNRRIHRALMAHWLAAGSKDGKISLWEIF